MEAYYPYRDEHRLLCHHAGGIAAHLPHGGVVVELGCGDGSKTALLLSALLRRHGGSGVRLCGVDCSAEALRQAQRNLGMLLPQLPPEQVGGHGGPASFSFQGTCRPAPAAAVRFCRWACC